MAEPMDKRVLPISKPMERSVPATAKDGNTVVVHRLTYDQIQQLWTRARLVLRSPFHGAFNANIYDVSFEAICHDRATIRANGKELDLWSETAALLQRQEKQFVSDFKLSVLQLTGRPHHDRKPLDLPNHFRYNTNGDDYPAFAAQFRLVEESKLAFQWHRPLSAGQAYALSNETTFSQG